MSNSKIFFPQEIYENHLTTINGIRLTYREISIIACLLNGRRTSAIASLFSISPRTVTTHFHNIMAKIDCNSQDGIISFIERASEFSLIKQLYSELITYTTFEKKLKEILKRKKEDPIKKFGIRSKSEGSLIFT